MSVGVTVAAFAKLHTTDVDQRQILLVCAYVRACVCVCVCVWGGVMVETFAKFHKTDVDQRPSLLVTCDNAKIRHAPRLAQLLISQRPACYRQLSVTPVYSSSSVLPCDPNT